MVSNPNFLVSQVPSVPVNTSPMGINLQTGRIISAGPALTTANLAAKPSDGTTNLAIAPKQLVLITADQQKVQPTSIIPVSSTVDASNRVNLAVKAPTSADAPKNAVISYTALSKLQTVNPAIITAVPPKTMSDGVRSFVPVMLTTKPLSTDTSSVGSAYLGGGVTFVLPSATASNSAIQVAAPSVVQTAASASQFANNTN